MYLCPFAGCGRNYKRLASLQYHLATHRTASPFKCPLPLCVRRFRTHEGLQEHVSLVGKDCRTRLEDLDLWEGNIEGEIELKDHTAKQNGTSLRAKRKRSLDIANRGPHPRLESDSDQPQQECDGEQYRDLVEASKESLSASTAASHVSRTIETENSRSESKISNRHSYRKKSAVQVQALRKLYENNNYPSREAKEDLAIKVGLKYDEIDQWLSNRRRAGKDSKSAPSSHVRSTNEKAAPCPPPPVIQTTATHSIKDRNGFKISSAQQNKLEKMINRLNPDESQYALWLLITSMMKRSDNRHRVRPYEKMWELVEKIAVFAANECRHSEETSNSENESRQKQVVELLSDVFSSRRDYIVNIVRRLNLEDVLAFSALKKARKSAS